jgi:hypothetical protein
MLVPPSSHGISNPCYSGYPQSPCASSATGLSPCTVPRSSGLRVTSLGVRGSTTPHFHWVSPADSDCPVPSSIAFTEGISLISFLLATKMLQSARFPYPKGMHRGTVQDVQFGHSRIKDSLRLPGTYRSLARPSSALEPSHPPCGVTAA